MASLIVRDLDDRIVEALKSLAARHKRGAEAESVEGHSWRYPRALFSGNSRFIDAVLRR